MQASLPLRRASEHRYHHYRGLYLGVSSHYNTSTVTTALVCQSYFIDYTCSKLVAHGACAQRLVHMARKLDNMSWVTGLRSHRQQHRAKQAKVPKTTA